jgi:hypothetical protein
MPLKYPVSGGTDFKLVPAGSHLAFCIAVVDLGLQPGAGRFPKPKHQLHLRFETPNERTEYEKDGRQIEAPMVIGSTYTASMSSKAFLRQHLESWRGRPFTDAEAADFDIAKVVGNPCMITVVHEAGGNGKTYANIKGISPVPKGMPVPAGPENKPIVYTPGDVSAYDRLPEWLRKKIDAQLVEQREVSSAEAAEFEDDQIPF